MVPRGCPGTFVTAQGGAQGVKFAHGVFLMVPETPMCLPYRSGKLTPESTRVGGMSGQPLMSIWSFHDSLKITEHDTNMFPNMYPNLYGNLLGYVGYIHLCPVRPIGPCWDHLCQFYVFFTKGVQIKDGELSVPSKFTSC